MDDISVSTTAWLAFTLTFDASAKYCDYLHREGFTPTQIAKLLSHYLDGTAPPQGKSLVDALGTQLSRAQLDGMHAKALQQKIHEALAWAQSRPEHHLLGLDHPAYPAQLLDTSNPPPLLYAKGDLKALEYPAVAIVGSRKASRQAIDLTHTLASALAARGITIISGLARGIDAAAHNGALAVGGRTIAVAATEPESVYPKHHVALERQIVTNGGLIITEYPLGAPTLRWYFPRRNRIISALSTGVLVAEASLPSGTLTTAAHAADQGREVMAIPGSVFNPQAKGCHALIKQGAALVESEEDILDVLGLASLCRLQAAGAAESPDAQQGNLALEPADEVESLILQALNAAPASMDELLTHTHCSVEQMSTKLGLMEIEGLIKACSGGRYARC